MRLWILAVILLQFIIMDKVFKKGTTCSVINCDFDSGNDVFTYHRFPIEDLLVLEYI